MLKVLIVSIFLIEFAKCDTFDFFTFTQFWPYETCRNSRNDTSLCEIPGKKGAKNIKHRKTEN